MSKFQTTDRWAEVRAELAKLREELAALSPAGRKPPLEQLKAKLAALESKIGQTGRKAR